MEKDRLKAHSLIDSFEDYIDCLTSFDLKGLEITLFRGQSSDYMLLPCIARNNMREDSTLLEKVMLAELRRPTAHNQNLKSLSDWEMLIVAQHYGMKTRLLDWTSNPLAALWFACKDISCIKSSSFVYVFLADKSYFTDTNKDPFDYGKTMIYQPNLNNDRILAQSGWFTAHKFSKKSKRFVPLLNNSVLKQLIFKIEILPLNKIEILNKLATMGANYQKFYPDLEGVCKHLNWKFIDKNIKI
jgi:hypothetical protein